MDREIDVNTIRPLRGMVLGKLVREKEFTPGGILLPDSARYNKHEIEVVRLGESDPKNPWPEGLKAGDRLVINSYGGREMDFNRQDYIFLKSDEIAAVFTDE